MKHSQDINKPANFSGQMNITYGQWPINSVMTIKNQTKHWRNVSWS